MLPPLCRPRFLILAALLLGLAGMPAGPDPVEAQETTIRDFTLPLPLFKADSAWNQRADTAAVLPESETQILILYRTLLGDRTGLMPPGYGLDDPWPYMDVNCDHYAVPIFRAGSAMAPVELIDYQGSPGGVTDKFILNPDGTIDIPSPDGAVRPSGPEGTEADGHLILFNPATGLMYDLWQATTARNGDGTSQGGGQVGPVIHSAGAADYFSADGSGANPPGYFSATATGAPLIAGLITPEDIESGVIAHALACAVPGLRNTNTDDPYAPFPWDIYYPASLTEGDFYNTNPLSLAAGQRLRLKETLVGEDGLPLDETALAPITRMFLQALRIYGLYLRDNAGGFTFYAEDVHTAPLNLPLEEVNRLSGREPGSSLEAGRTPWQLLMETLNLNLELIPLAVGWEGDGHDPSKATITAANFEVISPAGQPAQ